MARTHPGTTIQGTYSSTTLSGWWCAQSGVERSAQLPRRTAVGVDRLVLRFDPKKSAAVTAGKLPSPLQNAAATVVGDIGYLVGGLTPPGNPGRHGCHPEVGSHLRLMSRPEVAPEAAYPEIVGPSQRANICSGAGRLLFGYFGRYPGLCFHCFDPPFVDVWTLGFHFYLSLIRVLVAGVVPRLDGIPSGVAELQ